MVIRAIDGRDNSLFHVGVEARSMSEYGEHGLDRMEAALVWRDEEDKMISIETNSSILEPLDLRQMSMLLHP